MKNYIDFTEGRVFLPMMRFAIPLLGALFLQSMYSAIDILILGKFTDAVNVSAVSTGSFIMATLTFIIVGIASGTTILLGNRIGQKRLDEAGDVV
ncbi:MAG: MATE family efflux transporter, partial [Spirochaetales bacterium]|nr:MATE family efflux transporter [Spirochaetales bacterium]